jgi:hypothetical protein
MGRNERHVVPHPSGYWEVVAPGASRPSGRFDEQEQAIDRARQILNRGGGGELVVHGRDGAIREKDTVPPARDPNPPRDRT